MARQQIRTYIFTPGGAGAGTIQIPGKWDLNQLTIITNSTRNTILFNFADPTYSGTSVAFARNNTSDFPQELGRSDGITTVTLGYSTSGQSSSDSLQIFVEKNEMTVRPWAFGTDAFERTRVANPQSMLDADFEYGLQPTKWQTVSLVRNYPSIYEIPGTDQTISTITTDASGGSSSGDGVDSLITVVTTFPHGITTGTAVIVKGLDTSRNGFARAEGSFIVNAVTGLFQFNYYAKDKVGTNNGETLSLPTTIVRKGGFYTGAAIGTPTFSTAGSGLATSGTVTVSFTNNHGLLPGDGITVVITSDNGTNNHALCQGTFFVNSTTSLTSLQYSARNTGTITGTPLGVIYGRSDAYYQHRPFDGGVSLGAGGPSYGSTAIRMSKKYIRYQSGKAINYNTGALFAPNYDVRSVTASGTAAGSPITVTTDDQDHGLQVGGYVQLSGVTTPGYNGVYAVTTVTNERVFSVISTTTLASATPVLGSPCNLQHTSWHGTTIRLGTYDDQNGVFWQNDGETVALGLRTSTIQLAGTASATPDNNLLTGTNSRYTDQLVAGDRIVIRGMSHVVTNVTSSSWIYVNPDYRGVSAVSGAKLVKTVDRLYPQNQWNVDRCDGSNGPFNPSGYRIDITKMQMVGMQWTWYGAGFIDWMLRGPDGNYITVHRVKNSNVNTEAYMRSGNQPVRYEVTNEGAKSILANNMDATMTAMTVTDVTYFPNTGTVYIDNELINYTARSATSGTAQLTGLTRNGTLRYYIGGANRVFNGGLAATHTSGTGVLLVSQTATPTVSHWGSAFLSDGGFDQDRGYIFNYQATNVTVSTRKTTIFGIRLAPSVSNAVVGDLGVRDLINRAQLLLQAIEITAAGSTNTNQAIVIEGVLNPSNYPNTTTNVTWFSLQGTVAGGNVLGSGQPSFAQIAPSNSILFDGTATIVSNLSAQATAGSTTISVNTSSLAIGDAIFTATNNFAGNTLISSIGGGTVTLTQPSLTTLANGVPVVFTRNQWANPGETIFSFISSPANKDSLDLSALKELTSTPIGGRGTFPNGPDTLFINVYVTQGNPIPVNLVLRWGEAQA